MGVLKLHLFHTDGAMVALATTTLGPRFACGAQATPRADVDVASQAAAALVCLNESSQVTSRSLIQKHPDFLLDRRTEEMQEDEGDSGKHDGGWGWHWVDGWRLV